MADTVNPSSQDQDPYSQVDRVLNNAETYATNAMTSLNSFTGSLETTLYSAPVLNVTWSSLAEPEIPEAAQAPDLQVVSFTAPNLPDVDPLPDVVIEFDEFNEPAPTLPTLVAPTLNFGTVPVVPDITGVSIPDAPTLDVVTLPTYLSLSTPTFGGVDLHLDWLEKLENIPELELVSPTPFSYARGPEYASALLGALKAKLVGRLEGGTGLPEAVEQAIWDRARSRETNTARANEAEILRAAEALGYALPPGVLAAQLRQAQQAYYDKISGLSRDIAIKQAELEQENLKQTIAAGMQLEGQLIDYSYKMEAMAFEAAKTYADNALAIYNGSLEAYKALLTGYQMYASAYKTIIEAEMAKIEVYKAELSAEQTKATVNQTLVAQYKAQIEASMAQVDIYKAQVGGAQALIGLEQAKIGAAGEQIRAFVAQINAETAKLEAFKTEVQAQGQQVEVYKAKAQAFGTVVGAQAEKARVTIARYSAVAQQNSSAWEGYKAQVQGKIAELEAIKATNAQLLDSYRAENSAVEATAGMATQVWRTKIADYEAGRNLLLNQTKINNDALMTANQARLDAAKTGAQVYAQLSASAYSMMHGSASISGSAANSVSYSYSNDTTGAAATQTWAPS